MRLAEPAKERLAAELANEQGLDATGKDQLQRAKKILTPYLEKFFSRPVTINLQGELDLKSILFTVHQRAVPAEIKSSADGKGASSIRFDSLPSNIQQRALQSYVLTNLPKIKFQIQKGEPRGSTHGIQSVADLTMVLGQLQKTLLPQSVSPHTSVEASTLDEDYVHILSMQKSKSSSGSESEREKEKKEKEKELKAPVSGEITETGPDKLRLVASAFDKSKSGSGDGEGKSRGSEGSRSSDPMGARNFNLFSCCSLTQQEYIALKTIDHRGIKTSSLLPSFRDSTLEELIDELLFDWSKPLEFKDGPPRLSGTPEQKNKKPEDSEGTPGSQYRRLVDILRDNSQEADEKGRKPLRSRLQIMQLMQVAILKRCDGRVKVNVVGGKTGANFSLDSLERIEAWVCGLAESVTRISIQQQSTAQFVAKVVEEVLYMAQRGYSVENARTHIETSVRQYGLYSQHIEENDQKNVKIEEENQQALKSFRYLILNELGRQADVNPLAKSLAVNVKIDQIIYRVIDTDSRSPSQTPRHSSADAAHLALSPTRPIHDRGLSSAVLATTQTPMPMHRVVDSMAFLPIGSSETAPEKAQRRCPNARVRKIFRAIYERETNRELVGQREIFIKTREAVLNIQVRFEQAIQDGAVKFDKFAAEIRAQLIVEVNPLWDKTLIEMVTEGLSHRDPQIHGSYQKLVIALVNQLQNIESPTEHTNETIKALLDILVDKMLVVKFPKTAAGFEYNAFTSEIKLEKQERKDKDKDKEGKEKDKDKEDKDGQGLLKTVVHRQLVQRWSHMPVCPDRDVLTSKIEQNFGDVVIRAAYTTKDGFTQYRNADATEEKVEAFVKSLTEARGRLPNAKSFARFDSYLAPFFIAALQDPSSSAFYEAALQKYLKMVFWTDRITLENDYFRNFLAPYRHLCEPEQFARIEGFCYQTLSETISPNDTFVAFCISDAAQQVADRLVANCVEFKLVKVDEKQSHLQLVDPNHHELMKGKTGINADLERHRQKFLKTNRGWMIRFDHDLAAALKRKKFDDNVIEHLSGAAAWEIVGEMSEYKDWGREYEAQEEFKDKSPASQFVEKLQSHCTAHSTTLKGVQGSFARVVQQQLTLLDSPLKPLALLVLTDPYDFACSLLANPGKLADEFKEPTETYTRELNEKFKRLRPVLGRVPKDRKEEQKQQMRVLESKKVKLCEQLMQSNCEQLFVLIDKADRAVPRLPTEGKHAPQSGSVSEHKKAYDPVTPETAASLFANTMWLFADRVEVPNIHVYESFPPQRIMEVLSTVNNGRTLLHAAFASHNQYLHADMRKLVTRVFGGEDAQKDGKFHPNDKILKEELALLNLLIKTKDSNGKSALATLHQTDFSEFHRILLHLVRCFHNLTMTNKDLQDHDHRDLNTTFPERFAELRIELLQELEKVRVRHPDSRQHANLQYSIGQLNSILVLDPKQDFKALTATPHDEFRADSNPERSPPSFVTEFKSESFVKALGGKKDPIEALRICLLGFLHMRQVKLEARKIGNLPLKATMACFATHIKAIEQLQKRLNPTELKSNGAAVVEQVAQETLLLENSLHKYLMMKRMTLPDEVDEVFELEAKFFAGFIDHPTAQKEVRRIVDVSTGEYKQPEVQTSGGGYYQGSSTVTMFAKVLAANLNPDGHHFHLEQWAKIAEKQFKR